MVKVINVSQQAAMDITECFLFLRSFSGFSMQKYEAHTLAKQKL